ncbi:hypothetical protein DEO72_LG5g538 [Vigna unguiculata]|uniref:Uncharacterized protein n=1 Tax=Vigna unguiculata TaxID=3917 RepID=A0A4D6LX68_VIGUN|nr:hypothetical protein DEO72_LG5g538 [Vigna unguiculata]
MTFGFENWGFHTEFAQGDEILGIAQKGMHRLAARGLSPGASAGITPLRGCEVGKQFEGTKNVFFNGMKMIAKILNNCESEYGIEAIVILALDRSRKLDKILRYHNCVGTNTAPGGGFKPPDDSCSSSEYQRVWRLATMDDAPGDDGETNEQQGVWRLAVRVPRQAVWELAALGGTCPSLGDFTVAALGTLELWLGLASVAGVSVLVVASTDGSRWIALLSMAASHLEVITRKEFAQGDEILGIAQKGMHRLAARGLSPGASAGITPLRGCEVGKQFEGTKNVFFNGMKMIAKILNNCESEYGIEAIVILALDRSRKLDKILRYHNCVGTNTAPGGGFKPPDDSCSSSEYQRVWRLATMDDAPGDDGETNEQQGVWRLAVRVPRQAVWELAALGGTCPSLGDFTVAALGC